MPTIGERLLTLKARSGLSLAQIAARAGYRGASSIQKLFRADYNPDALQGGVAERLADAFVGQGDPPIMLDEMTGLALNKGFELLSSELMHYSYLASTEIPLLSAERDAHQVETTDGKPIALFTLNRADATYCYDTPKFLIPRWITGFYIAVGSMWPRFEEGELAFFEARAPATSGDDVVVALTGDDPNEKERMLLARLSSVNEDEITLEIFRPQGRIVLPRSRVSSMHRLMRRADFLEGPPRLSTLKNLQFTDID